MRRRDPLPSARDIDDLTRRLLTESGATGFLPTPIDVLVAHAGLRDAGSDLFADETLQAAPPHLRAAMMALKQRVRAVLDRREGEIHVDIEAAGTAGKPFKVLHEVVHHLCPWQQDLAYADDDLTLSASTDVRFEREANYGASQLLFQHDLFTAIASDYPVSMDTVTDLAKIFGASIHSTFRRFVQSEGRVVAGLVLRSGILPGTYERRETYASPAWWRTMGSPRHLPKFLDATTAPDVVAAIPAVRSRAQSTMIWGGTQGHRTVTVEGFDSRHRVFLLLRPALQRVPAR